MIHRADINQKKIVTALRKMGVTVAPLSQVGNGVPDLLCGYSGKNYLIEVKNPAKKWKLTEQQVTFHEVWRGQIHIVESVDDILKIFERKKNEKGEANENNSDR